MTVTGAEIELDRAILDDLAEPLLHLLRNAQSTTASRRPRRGPAPKKPPAGRVHVSVRRTTRPGGGGAGGRRAGDGRPRSSRTPPWPGGKLSPEAAARLTDARCSMACPPPGVSTATDVTDNFRAAGGDGRGEARRGELGRDAGDRVRAGARHPLHPCAFPSRWPWSSSCWSGRGRRCGPAHRQGAGRRRRTPRRSAAALGDPSPPTDAALVPVHILEDSSRCRPRPPGGVAPSW